MARPRIAYALRASATGKPGGDSAKITRYAKGQAVRGFDTALVCSTADLVRMRPQLVHLSNIDLAFENYAYSRWCVRHGVPYVISTIHHDAVAVEAYYQRGSGNAFNSALRRVGISADSAALLREGLTGVRHGAAAPLLAGLGLGMREMQRFVLQNATRIYPMAGGELDSLEADIGSARDRSRLIYNPFTFVDAMRAAGGGAPRRSGILCVGRIEPRKNQIGVMEALKGTGIEVTFVGMENRNHPGYLKRFKTLLGSFPAFRHVPHVSQEALVEYYRRARLHVSLSWFEVVSQVDLEALSHGCHILPTRCGFVREYLTGPCAEYDPLNEYDSVAAIREKILSAYASRDFPSVKSAFLHSWEFVNDVLEEEYRDLV